MGLVDSDDEEIAISPTRTEFVVIKERLKDRTNIPDAEWVTEKVGLFQEAQNNRRFNRMHLLHEKFNTLLALPA